MFRIDHDTGAIVMHAGDTGAYKVRAVRQSGTAWTANDRLVFTVRNSSGTAVMQRYYRLDTELGNGVAVIQFHNPDTDEWPAGIYQTERRYVAGALWDGEVQTGECVNALLAASHIVDGVPVRIPDGAQSTLEIRTSYGRV